MTTLLRSVLPLACVLGFGVAAAQGENLGKYEYRANCAVCHGQTGHGEGPMRAHLVKAPADLTKLAKRNGGDFPAERVLRVIDGRTAIGSHGTREMPVWGEVFSEQERAQPPAGRGRVGPEWTVQKRLLELVEYLRQRQEK